MNLATFGNLGTFRKNIPERPFKRTLDMKRVTVSLETEEMN